MFEGCCSLKNLDIGNYQINAIGRLVIGASAIENIEAAPSNTRYFSKDGVRRSLLQEW